MGKTRAKESEVGTGKVIIPVLNKAHHAMEAYEEEKT
jgi:hypothetical protein